MPDPDKTAAYTRTIVEAMEFEHPQCEIGPLLGALADVAGRALALSGNDRVPVSFAARVEGTRARVAAERAQKVEGGER